MLSAIVPAIRAAIREIDPTVPLFNVRTQDEQLERLFAKERLFANLCSAFGGLALILTLLVFATGNDLGVWNKLERLIG